MKYSRITVLMAGMAMLAMLGAPALALAHTVVAASLQGFEEPPAISTTASGTFDGEVSSDQTSIAYVLSYAGLEGDVRQAHIHLGQFSVNGGISIWLCQTTSNPDPTGLAPTCPQEGTVTGTVTAANVIGPTGQGINAGEFDKIITAMLAGVTYANVHSTKHPGGEIRGQIAEVP